MNKKPNVNLCFKVNPDAIKQAVAEGCTNPSQEDLLHALKSIHHYMENANWESSIPTVYATTLHVNHIGKLSDHDGLCIAEITATKVDKVMEYADVCLSLIAGSLHRRFEGMEFNDE